MRFPMQEIMTAQSVDETKSSEVGPVEVSNVNEMTFYIVGNGAVASGVVTIEEAHLAGYTGTWAPVGSPVTVSADAVQTVKATGVSHVFRARISTVIVGGTVSVFVQGR